MPKTLTDEMKELEALGVLHVIGGVPEGIPSREQLATTQKLITEYYKKFAEQKLDPLP